MSFYSLRKLFGYEVGPEDPLGVDIAQQEADVAAKKAAVWEERTKDKRYIPSWERIPRNVTRRRSERKQESLLKKQENIQEGRHSDRDMDILISRQEDPLVREYQEKAIAEKRFQDTAFKLGIGPSGQSAYSRTDPYMPSIAGIQKKHGVKPNKIQAAVVKEIDAWNQANRGRNRRNEWRGPMPSPKRLLGDKYDKTKRYDWRNTGENIASILDFDDEMMERFKDEDPMMFKQGAYSQTEWGTAVGDRIEWLEPITESDRKSIAHEQLHRYIKSSDAGRATRHLDGDHEFFVRAYTHLLNGGNLDDRSLREDIEFQQSRYSGTDSERFFKDLPGKIKAFERTVLGSDYRYAPNRGRELEEIVVWGTRHNKGDPVDEQMQNLMSAPTKVNSKIINTYLKNNNITEEEAYSTSWLKKGQEVYPEQSVKLPIELITPYYGNGTSPVKLKESVAEDLLAVQKKYNKPILIVDNTLTLEAKMKSHNKWIAGGKEGPRQAGHKSFHIHGQAIDLNRPYYENKKEELKILFPLLKEQGFEQVSREWWHWSKGEVTNPIAIIYPK